MNSFHKERDLQLVDLFVQQNLLIKPVATMVTKYVPLHEKAENLKKRIDNDLDEYLTTFSHRLVDKLISEMYSNVGGSVSINFQDLFYHVSPECPFSEPFLDKARPKVSLLVFTLLTDLGYKIIKCSCGSYYISVEKFSVLCKKCNFMRYSS